VTPDLDALWRDLGITVKDGKPVLDDKAPHAAVRRAISAKPAAAAAAGASAGRTSVPATTAGAPDAVPTPRH
jgi:hypothetical protein